MLLIYEFQQSILCKIRQQNEFNNQPSHVGMKTTDHLIIEVFISIEVVCIACSFGLLLNDFLGSHNFHHQLEMEARVKTSNVWVLDGEGIVSECSVIGCSFVLEWEWHVLN